MEHAYQFLHVYTILNPDTISPIQYYNHVQLKLLSISLHVKNVSYLIFTF